jgi:trypsin-like peptidase/FHA domain-containing protein
MNGASLARPQTKVCATIPPDQAISRVNPRWHRLQPVLLMVIASCAFAQSASDKMIQSSVAVFGTIEENGKPKLVSRGGGFLIDSRHVVTNLTACCGKTDKGEATQPVVVAGDKDASTAKVVWKNEDTEMAILELKDPITRPALAIAPLKTVEKEQAVYTAQFPDPGESGTVPKITDGKLLGLVKIESSGVQAYKTSASMNKANSGGALFDACGNVIGVNMMVKEGAQFAYVVDPLLEGLKSAGVQAKVASEHCGSAAAATTASGGGEEKESEASRWGPRGLEWIPVVLLLAAIGMAFRPSRKKASQAVLNNQSLPEPARYAPQIAPMAQAVSGVMGTRPALRGVAGQYEGKSFSLDSGPSVLGRDQRSANLVFAPEAHSISKRHCMVSWDAARKTFVIQDLGSTNGTFLSTGERLTAGQSRDLPVGSRFYVGDLRNQFEVRME